MTISNYKISLLKEQVKALYGGIILSLSAYLLIAIIIHLFLIDKIESIHPPSFSWIFIALGSASLYAIHAFLYFKTDISKRNNKLLLKRFALHSLIGAVSWGVLFWYYFPLSSQEGQFHLILLAVGIAAFTSTNLSYHLGIIIPVLLILFAPLEIRLLMISSDFHGTLSILIPIFLISMIGSAIRTNRLFVRSVKIKLEFLEKEKEYKNLQHAVDQHNIVNITDTEGNILYANSKSEQITKYSNNVLVGSTRQILNSGEHSDSFWKEMWETITSGNIWKGEIKNVNKYGKHYWINSSIIPFLDENNKPYQYITINTEITKLKELEQQNIDDKNDALIRAKIAHILHAQTPLKVRIAEALKEISKTLDLPTDNKLGVMALANGAKKLELYATHGRHDETCQHQTQCREVMNTLFKDAISSKKPQISELCFFDPNHNYNDEEIKVHGHYIIPLLHNDKVLGILFMYTAPNPSNDYTRQDTLRYIGNLIGVAIANEYAKENLKKSHKYAVDTAQSKSDFLANMSHEIRTPMNGVLGMLDLLNDLSLDNQAKEYVETAHSSANMLLNVINDILDISKIESGKLHIESINFNLRKALEDTTALLSHIAHQKNLELLCYIPPDTSILLKGDMLRLQQVTNNLLNNAIKFTHEGEVSIHLSTIENSEQKTKIRFEIRDTGIGIPKEKQTSLFQAFTQADTSTSREYGGTGLGLTISKKLIEMMGGEIGFNSTEGKGSIFWFELPFDTLSQEDASYSHLDKLRILTIDDNKTNCLILEKYVESWGAESIVSTQPESGLSLLTEACEKNQPFDILLLDMQMPEMTGKDVAEKIRQNPLLAKLKIIMLSSMGLDTDTGAQGHYDLMLNKPIRQSYLYDAVATVQNQQLLSNQEEGIDKTTDKAKPETKKLDVTVKVKNTSKGLTGKILFVDDSLVNQYVGKEILTKLGLDFEVTKNGQEALDARKSGNFDLILMDCQMPVMDGYEATRQIRSYEQENNKKHITIVALTANAMQGDREKCIDSGMDDYLTKPYTTQDLDKMLSRYLNHEIEAEADADAASTKEEASAT